MTEHVQIEMITAVVNIVGLLVVLWRADIAARAAGNASQDAKFAASTAVTLGATQSAAIAEVHNAVNGGAAASKKEIIELKAHVNELNGQITGLNEVITALRANL